MNPERLRMAGSTMVGSGSSLSLGKLMLECRRFEVLTGCIGCTSCLEELAHRKESERVGQEAEG